MKYRKRPVEIDAMQFTDEDKDIVYNWAVSLQGNVYHSWDEDPEFNAAAKPVLMIPTLEGEMTASLGDYIIQGEKGELYPCKPDIFDLTYEKV